MFGMPLKLIRLNERILRFLTPYRMSHPKHVQSRRPENGGITFLRNIGANLLSRTL